MVEKVKTTKNGLLIKTTQDFRKFGIRKEVPNLELFTKRRKTERIFDIKAIN